jgi:hypothetical protein
MATTAFPAAFLAESRRRSDPDPADAGARLFRDDGFVVQAVADAFWAPLPSAFRRLSRPLIATFPWSVASSRAVARIVPRDETYAVDLD